MEQIVERQWFVMSAIYGQEMKIKSILEELEIECFVPMQTTYEEIGGRVLQKTAPAVKNLIFVYVDKPTLQHTKARYQYFQYYTHVVDGKRVPIVVPELEMQNFLRAVNINDNRIIYHNQDTIELEKGAQVKIIGGEFDGIEGEFVRFSGKRNRSFVVRVNGILRVELTEIDFKTNIVIKSDLR